MIIFGTRGHYSATGGVENSLRNLLKVASQQCKKSILVCRQPLAGEGLDNMSDALPRDVRLCSYVDEKNTKFLVRLLHLAAGGKVLTELYLELYREYPNAQVIVRHHAHALAAYTVGFHDVRYLVPSLTEVQLAADIKEVAFLKKVKLAMHMLVDGWAQRRALNRVSLFVFSRSLERGVRKRLRRKYRNKDIKIVSPGIDSVRFYPSNKSQKRELRAQLQLPEAQNLLLYIGRFSHGKGIEFSLRALHHLPTSYSLVLVGEGDIEALLRQTIQCEGLASRVLLKGSTSRVEDYYRACDIHTMPSLTEGFGQTLLEAAACGLRSVAFHRSSGVVTATHEMGLDMAIDYAYELSSRAFASAILRADESITRKNLKTISGTIYKRYDWGALLDRLLV